jgi:hypothetical protein
MGSMVSHLSWAIAFLCMRSYGGADAGSIGRFKRIESTWRLYTISTASSQLLELAGRPSIERPIAQIPLSLRPAVSLA